ncbi:MAG: hypothetical protein JW737_10425 [Acidobacteria bacterium]|nr:hypothetical protein [Acidobacteriota bacterium]
MQNDKIHSTITGFLITIYLGPGYTKSEIRELIQRELNVFKNEPEDLIKRLNIVLKVINEEFNKTEYIERKEDREITSRITKIVGQELLDSELEDMFYELLIAMGNRIDGQKHLVKDLKDIKNNIL